MSENLILVSNLLSYWDWPFSDLWNQVLFWLRAAAVRKFSCMGVRNHENWQWMEIEYLAESRASTLTSCLRCLCHIVAGLCYGGCHLGNYGNSAPVGSNFDVTAAEINNASVWHNVVNRSWPHNLLDGSLYSRVPSAVPRAAVTGVQANDHFSQKVQHLHHSCPVSNGCMYTNWQGKRRMNSTFDQ